MKASAGSYSGSEVSLQLPRPLQALCKSCKSLTTHRPGGPAAGTFMSGGFMRLLPCQAPQLLPGASPQPVKIQSHKS